jgi:hypothetical protein
MTMCHDHEHRWFYDGVLRVMITVTCYGSALTNLVLVSALVMRLTNLKWAMQVLE